MTTRLSYYWSKIVSSFVCNKPKVKFMQCVNHNYIIPHAQNPTALLLNVFLTEIHRLLFTYKNNSAFPSANNCQGRLKTPQSATAFKTLSGHIERGLPLRAAVSARDGQTFKLYYIRLHHPRQTERGLPQRTSLERCGLRAVVCCRQICQAGSTAWRKNWSSPVRCVLHNPRP